MKRSVIIAAVFGVVVTAVAGTAQNQPVHKSHARHAVHQRTRKHYHHKPTKGGAHREGPLQVRPDGTVVPNGLNPIVVPVPEVLKKKGPPQS